MKAIVRRRYGSPEQLELDDIERPAPRDGDVLVRVMAASVNPGDIHLIRGRPLMLRLAGYGLRRPRRIVPGIDLAGVVEAVGRNVTAVRPGDEVFGGADGSFAEFAIASEGRLARKPANLSFAEAAAVPVAGCAALQGLRDKGRAGAGQSVLVIGASGGIGTFAVQIARSLGASVTAVCRARNADLVRSLGAERVVDYGREDVARLDGRYDVVLQVAGTRSPLALRRILAPKGTLVLCSGEGRVNGVDRMAKAALVSPFVGQRLVAWESKENSADLAALAKLIEAGDVCPAIDRTYPLAEAAAAVAHVESGHTRGKVVLAF